ncbi:hypothetical protein ACSLUB_07065 [Bordetella hinzii]|uniref:hypothetical protein n=1 Tax=Bordetella hinzii TaxID=103855 RepID=UPI003F1C805C
MEWIIENKTWLFSGIAIAIPLAAIGWLTSSRKTKQSQKSGKKSVNIQVGGNLKIGKGKNDE